MAGRRAAGRSFTFSGQGEAIVRRCVMLKLRSVLEEGRESPSHVRAVAAAWEELMKDELPQHHPGADDLRERVKGYKRTRC